MPIFSSRARSLVNIIKIRENKIAIVRGPDTKLAILYKEIYIINIR